MTTDNQVTCSICGHEKQELPERTQIGHEPIYVCTQKASKKSLPCDGWVYEIATRRV